MLGHWSSVEERAPLIICNKESKTITWVSNNKVSLYLMGSCNSQGKQIPLFTLALIFSEIYLALCDTIDWVITASQVCSCSNPQNLIIFLYEANETYWCDYTTGLGKKRCAGDV